MPLFLNGKDSVGRKLKTRLAWLIGAGLVAIGVLFLAGSMDLGTAAAQVPGATYTGTTATGAEVELNVNADGTALSSLRFGAAEGQGGPPGIESPCGIGQSFESQFGQGLAITNGSFTHTSDIAPAPGISGDIIVNGTFSDSQATGTIAMVFPSDPGCNTGDISWSASTGGAPPPPPPAGPQQAGATYEGTVDDGTISLTVSSDGSGVSGVKIANLTTYCFVVNVDVPLSPPAPITNGAFAFSIDEATFDLSISGTFTSATAVSGSVSITDDAGDPDCDAELAFTA
ncbi:MAG: hypothetical protein U1B78_02615, partial [Dehalococcoidia bacterium]|nr:hypothetical protein [Dehalococcoidia bacterium]